MSKFIVCFREYISYGQLWFFFHSLCWGSPCSIELSQDKLFHRKAVCCFYQSNFASDQYSNLFANRTKTNLSYTGKRSSYSVLFCLIRKAELFFSSRLIFAKSDLKKTTSHFNTNVSGEGSPLYGFKN